MACTSRATVELAARRGLPMLLGMHIGDTDKADMVACYARAATAAGLDPNVEYVAAGVAQVGEDAPEELGAALPGWLEAGLAATRRSTAGPGRTWVDLKP